MTKIVFSLFMIQLLSNQSSWPDRSDNSLTTKALNTLTWSFKDGAAQAKKDSEMKSNVQVHLSL